MRDVHSPSKDFEKIILGTLRGRMGRMVGRTEVKKGVHNGEPQEEFKLKGNVQH